MPSLVEEGPVVYLSALLSWKYVEVQGFGFGGKCKKWERENLGKLPFSFFIFMHGREKMINMGRFTVLRFTPFLKVFAPPPRASKLSFKTKTSTLSI